MPNPPKPMNRVCHALARLLDDEPLDLADLLVVVSIAADQRVGPFALVWSRV